MTSFNDLVLKMEMRNVLLQQLGVGATTQGTFGQLVEKMGVSLDRDRSGFQNLNTPESAERVRDQVRRGFTREGMGMVDALANAGGFMTGVGTIASGIGAMANIATGEEPGTYGGPGTIRGWSDYSEEVQRALDSGKIKDIAGANTMQAELDAKKREVEASRSASQGHSGGRGTSSKGKSSRGSRGE